MSLRRSRSASSNAKVAVRRGPVKMRQVTDAPKEPEKPAAPSSGDAAPVEDDTSLYQITSADIRDSRQDLANARDDFLDFLRSDSLIGMLRRDYSAITSEIVRPTFAQAAAFLRFEIPRPYGRISSETYTPRYFAEVSHADVPASPQEPVRPLSPSREGAEFTIHGVAFGGRYASMASAAMHHALRHLLSDVYIAVTNTLHFGSCIVSFPVCGPTGTPIVVIVYSDPDGQIQVTAVDTWNMHVWPPTAARPDSRSRIVDAVQTTLTTVFEEQCGRLRSLYRAGR